MTLLRRSGAPGTSADPGRKVPGEEGIWVFVLGDMTVFALFFATFMYSRGKNHAVFARDHAELHVSLGTVNTVLLLSSSLLVVLAVQRVLGGRHAGAWQLIAGALCCGAGFVVVKAVESRAARPVAPGQFEGVLDTHAALFGTVDEEDAPERPKRLTAQVGGILLVDDGDFLAAASQLPRSDQPGQPTTDHNHVSIHRSLLTLNLRRYRIH